MKTAFGHLVVVDVPVAAPLHPGEAALTGGFGEKRLRTFTAGRHALRRALAEAGVVVDGAIVRPLDASTDPDTQPRHRQAGGQQVERDEPARRANHETCDHAPARKGRPRSGTRRARPRTRRPHARGTA